MNKFKAGDIVIIKNPNEAKRGQWEDILIEMMKHEWIVKNASWDGTYVMEDSRFDQVLDSYKGKSMAKAEYLWWECELEFADSKNSKAAKLLEELL